MAVGRCSLAKLGLTAMQREDVGGGRVILLHAQENLAR